MNSATEAAAMQHQIIELTRQRDEARQAVETQLGPKQSAALVRATIVDGDALRALCERWEAHPDAEVCGTCAHELRKLLDGESRS